MFRLCRDGKYRCPAGIPCTLVKLAARFGFASRDDGTGDIFIPGRALHGAMPQDKIIIKLFDHPVWRQRRG